MSTLQRQRGAAIIVAMLIMALASAAAIAALQQQDLALRQLTTARDYEQATWVLKGGWDPLESTCRHASLSIL